jgi:hypothetical protein
MPVQPAGEAVVVGEIAEPAVALVAFSDDAHDPVRAHRPARGASEPAAAVLDPEFGAGAGIEADAILGLEEDAAALVALVGLHDGIEPGLHIACVEQLRVAAAGRDRGDVRDAQHVEDVRAPDKRVALDVPIIERRAHRGENVGGVELGGDVRA